MSSDRLKSQFFAVLIFLASFLAPSTHAASLVWDANSEPDIAGYKVYYSDLNSGSSGVWNAGLNCEMPLNLEAGHSYVFSVTAYNQSGIESDPSESLRLDPPSEMLLVTWDPASDPSTANYTLSFGQLNQPAESVDAGSATELELANFLRGATYYFYVTSTNAGLTSVETWEPVTVVIPSEGALGTIHISRVNQAPQVALISPAVSSTFTAPATISLEASALDPDGAIVSVDFFAGATKIFTRTSAPYSATWSGVSAGTYQISAVATDSQGAATRSTSVTVTVQQPLPAPPANLLASVAETSIRLTWTDQSSNEAGFRLYRSTSGSSFALIETLGQNVQEFTNSGLVPGTFYTYRLTAYNSTGESAAAQVSATTPLVTILPPATITATPVAGGISVGWSLVSGATQYQVQRALSESGTFATIVTTQSNPYTDTTVTSGITYYYRVIAEGGGYRSQPSAIASAMLLEGAPAAPTSLKASSSGKSQVSLAWRDNSSNESNFVVERSLDGFSFSAVSTLPPNTTSSVDGAVAPKRRYFYRVRASNAAGSSFSPVVSIRTR